MLREVRNEMKYSLNEHQAKKLLTDNNLTESVGITGKINPETIQQLNESAKDKGSRKLIVQMEAIHVGRTANYTFYTEQGLRDGLESWTHPYNKPVLTHHNSHNGEAIGRILKAEYAESTMSGRKGLIFTCEITDPDSVERVLDGRYQTVSIGATTDKVTCNICGTDRTQEWCEHWRGDDYEGQTCHFVIGTTMGREVSYVNVPADENAGNISVSVQDDAPDNTNESVDMQIFQIAEGLMESVKLPGVNLYESATDDIRQLVDGLVKTNEGSATTMFYKLDENGKQVLDESGQPIPLTEAEIKEKLTEAQKEVKKLKTDLSEAQSTLATITVEKSKVDAQLVEATSETTRLTTENADLVAKAHKVLAEKVVDMKMLLRKADVVGVTPEEALEAHIKRTEESLTDAVTDLQNEMKNSSVVVGTVPNPGGEGADNDPKQQQQQQQSEKTTVAEAVSMFSNMFKAKK